MLKIPTAICLTLIAAFFLMSASCERAAPRIYGNIEGLPDGKVYLQRVLEDETEIIDSVRSNDGIFVITIPDIVPDILHISMESYPDSHIPVVVDGRSVFVSGNTLYGEQISVTGTPPNDALAGYSRSIGEMALANRVVEVALEPYRDSMTVIDSATFILLTAKRDSLQRLIGGFRREFVRDNPSSIVSAMIVSGDITSSTTQRQVDSLLGELDTENMYDNVFLRRIIRRQQSGQ